MGFVYFEPTDLGLHKHAIPRLAPDPNLMTADRPSMTSFGFHRDALCLRTDNRGTTT
jgi:hypothetical protein